MNFTLYQYKYISKDDSTYLKGLAILIMICLHVFGSRAVNCRLTNRWTTLFLWADHYPFVCHDFAVFVCIYIYC